MKGSDDEVSSQMPLGFAGLPWERIVSGRDVTRFLSFSQSRIKLLATLRRRNDIKHFSSLYRSFLITLDISTVA
jgi:hypothetical protein